MQRKDLPSPLRLGLVLSGGGAKGAYEEGVMQALARLGLAPLVEAVSGCSIGALNALLFAMGDPALWRRVWEEVGSRGLFSPGEEGPGPSPRERMEAARRASCLRELLAAGALASQDALRELVRREVDPQRLCSGRPRVSVCAYDLQEERPRYFWLEGRPFDQAVELAMASSAIPAVFPPVEAEGRYFCDGGMTPPYSRKRNADKVPAPPLADLGLDLTLVVYLNHYDQADLSGFPPGARVLELYPSQPLEAAPGAGTMDFSPETLRSHRELGWRDALAALAPLLADWARRLPPEKALAEHAAANRALLEREQSKNEAVAQRAREVREAREGEAVPGGGRG